MKSMKRTKSTRQKNQTRPMHEPMVMTKELRCP